jgi:peptide/nickel transport system substrate-binding protein
MTDHDFAGVSVPYGITRKAFLRGMMLAAAGFAVGRLGFVTDAHAQGKPEKGGIFNFNLTADPPNFDPLSNTSGTVLSIIAPCYSGLVRFDPLDPNAIASDAAKSWKVSDDGKTYTFSLFDNILFHDGGALTSADVVFSLDRVRNPPKGVVSNRKTMLDVVASIDAPDVRTVVITLKRPSPAFINTLASGWMVILSKKFVEAGGEPGKKVMGSGPFRFLEYVQGVSVELERNPKYFVADRPYLDSIKAYIIPDQGSTWNYLQSGQLQMWQSIQGSEAGQFKSNDDIEIVESPSTSMLGVTFNATAAPFNNPLLRKAAVLAIDRMAALNILQRGQGVFAGPIMPGPWSLDKAALEAVPGYGMDAAANLAEAKKIIADNGFGKLTIRLLVRRISLFEPVGVFLKDQWGKVGLDVNLDVQENATFFEKQSGRQFDAVVFGASVNTADPDDVAPWYQSGSSQNYAGLQNAKLDALADRISSELDPAKRKELANQWEKEIAGEYRIFVLYWRKRFMGLRRNVHNMVLHPNLDNNLKLQDLWLSS